MIPLVVGLLLGVALIVIVFAMGAKMLKQPIDYNLNLFPPPTRTTWTLFAVVALLFAALVYKS